jgi:spermidine synthase
MRLDAPLALELAYTRLMAAFLLFLPSPKQLLMVGLGGGSLARFCHRRLPRARISVVEIDATVIAMASQFGLVPDERLSILHADGAGHMPLAEADSDVVLLDAFDGEGVSGSLLDPGFYQAARRRLRPRGMLVANLAGAEDCWRAHLRLLRRAFDDQLILVRLSGGDNHVAFAFTDPAFPPAWSLLEKPARELQRTHGLDFPDFLRRLRRAAGR